MSTPQAQFNPYNRACPSRRLINDVGDIWSVLLVGALSRRSMRFSELSEEVDGISCKMLTKTLRSLERNGIVKRTQYNEMPVRVIYSLTEFGRTIVAPMESLENWVTDNMTEILQAQENFDASLQTKS